MTTLATLALLLAASAVHAFDTTVCTLPVSRILHHIHPFLIYEAIMRHLKDKYEAIMKQISLNILKNEVLGLAFLFTAKPLKNCSY